MLPHAGVAEALEGVRPKVVTLRLEKVGWQPLCPVTVEEGERGREGGSGNTKERGVSHDLPPALLTAVDGVDEIGREQQVLQAGLGVVSLLDLAQERGANDAPPAPHEGDLAVVERPSVGLGSFLQQHEALRVRNDLRREQRLPDALDEGRLVARVRRRRGAGQLLRREHALRLQGGEAARKHGLADKGDRHPLLERLDASPLAGALLPRCV
mmetsp:Transcript_2176/g.3488  ORF Transcript_2176/g.3488 Transcript_2176/m.3488 type:complete len:212 (-) Transcript_2176:791-1426(-)